MRIANLQLDGGSTDCGCFRRTVSANLSSLGKEVCVGAVFCAVAALVCLSVGSSAFQKSHQGPRADSGRYPPVEAKKPAPCKRSFVHALRRCVSRWQATKSLVPAVRGHAASSARLLKIQSARVAQAGRVARLDLVTRVLVEAMPLRSPASVLIGGRRRAAPACRSNPRGSCSGRGNRRSMAVVAPSARRPRSTAAATQHRAAAPPAPPPRLRPRRLRSVAAPHAAYMLVLTRRRAYSRRE